MRKESWLPLLKIFFTRLTIASRPQQVRSNNTKSLLYLVPVDSALKPVILPEKGSKGSVFSGQMGICYIILVFFHACPSLFSSKCANILDSPSATEVQAGTWTCPCPLLTAHREDTESCWSVHPPRERHQAKWARVTSWEETGEICNEKKSCAMSVNRAVPARGHKWQRNPTRGKEGVETLLSSTAT